MINLSHGLINCYFEISSNMILLIIIMIIIIIIIIDNNNDIEIGMNACIFVYGMTFNLGTMYSDPILYIMLWCWHLSVFILILPRYL